MAYVNVSNSRNGKASIDYVLNDKDTNNESNPRYIVKGGYNLDDDNANEDMRFIWEHYDKADGDYMQVYNITQSFATYELNADSSDDAEIANEIGLQLAGELYPDRQSLVVTQADGEGGKLHNHIVVNSVDMITGRSINEGKASWGRVADKSDEIIQREPYNMTPIVRDEQKYERNQYDKSTKEEEYMRGRGDYVFKDDMKERIERGLDDIYVVDEQSFVDKMSNLKDDNGKDINVDVKYARRGLSYMMVRKDEESVIDKNDEQVMQKVQAGKLGKKFQKSNLQKTFDVNAEKLKIQEQMAQQQAQAESDALIEQQRIEREREQQEQERQDKEFKELQEKLEAEKVERKRIAKNIDSENNDNREVIDRHIDKYAEVENEYKTKGRININGDEDYRALPYHVWQTTKSRIADEDMAIRRGDIEQQQEDEHELE